MNKNISVLNQAIKHYHNQLIRSFELAFMSSQFLLTFQEQAELAFNLIVKYVTRKTQTIVSILSNSIISNKIISQLSLPNLFPKINEDSLQLINDNYWDFYRTWLSSKEIQQLKIAANQQTLPLDQFQDFNQQLPKIQSAFNKLIEFQYKEALTQFINLICVDPQNKTYHFIALFLIILTQNQYDLLLQRNDKQQYFLSVCQTILFQQKMIDKLSQTIKKDYPNEGRKISKQKFDSREYYKYERAINFIKDNNFEQAIQILKQAIQQNKKNQFSYLLLSYIYTKDQRYGKKYAIQILNQSLRNNEQRNTQLLALVYMEMEQYNDAINLLQIMLEKIEKTERIEKNKTIFHSKSMEKLMLSIEKINGQKQKYMKELIQKCKYQLQNQIEQSKSDQPIDIKQLRRQYRGEMNKQFKIQKGLTLIELYKNYNLQYQRQALYRQILKLQPKPKVKWQFFKTIKNMKKQIQKQYQQQLIQLLQSIVKSKENQLNNQQLTELYTYLVEYYNRSNNIDKCLEFYQRMLQIKRSSQILLKWLKVILSKQKDNQLFMNQSNEDTNICFIFSSLKTLLMKKENNPQKYLEIMSQLQEQPIKHQQSFSSNTSLNNQFFTSFIDQKNQKDQSYSQSQQFQIDKLQIVIPQVIPRLEDCYKKLPNLTQSIGLMTFYWYDQKLRINKTTQGTGFLINSQTVITARHNFYQRNHPQLKCINCVIRFKNYYNQYVQYRSKPSEEWYQSSEQDFGLVILQKIVIHHRNDIKFLTRNEYINIKKGEELMLAGFSLQYRKQNNNIDQIKILKPKFIEHQNGYCDYQANTISGLSGSPVIYKYQSNSFYVLAVHVSRKIASQSCRGVLFTQKLANQIYYWIQLTKLKQYNLINCFNRFKKAIQNNNMVNVYQQMQEFQENLRVINKQTSLQYFKNNCKLTILQEITPNNKQKIMAATNRLINLYDIEKVKQFYIQLIQQIHQQLKRLNIKLEENKHKQNIQINKEIQEDNQSSQQNEEQSQVIMNYFQESYIQSSYQSQQSSFLQDFCSIIKNNQPYFEQLTKIQNKDGVFLKIFYEKYQQNFQFNKFRQLRNTIYLNIITMISNKHTQMPNFSIHQIIDNKELQKTQQGKQILRVQVKGGFDSNSWNKQFSLVIFLVFLRDLCRTIIDLERCQIIYPDLRFSNFILEVEQQNFNYHHYNSKQILSKINKLKFKLFNFDFAISFQNEEAIKASTELLKLGRQLLKEQTFFNNEPLSILIAESAQNNVIQSIKTIQSEQYNDYLRRQVEYARTKKQSKDLQSQLSNILNLTQERKYQEIIKKLQHMIIKQTPND